MAKDKSKVNGIRIMAYARPREFLAEFYPENFQRGIKPKTSVNGAAKVTEMRITNRQIRQAVSKYMLLPEYARGERLGHMRLDVYSAGTAQWETYHPVGNNDKIINIFSGRGIAQMLEYIVLLQMKKSYPLIRKIQHLLFVDRRRETQIEKRMLKAGELRSIDNEIALLKRKIAIDSKRNLPLRLRLRKKAIQIKRHFLKK